MSKKFVRVGLMVVFFVLVQIIVLALVVLIGNGGL